MYIRSQKGFLLCNATAIASLKTDKSKITNTIFAEMVDGCKIPLGFYDSYDRCKEIMHSIHNRQSKHRGCSKRFCPATFGRCCVFSSWQYK